MNLNENKGAKIAGIGGALVVATTVILNLTGILDWLGISPKSAPEEASSVSYETPETIPAKVTEQQKAVEKVTVLVTEAPTEPPTEPPPTEPQKRTTRLTDLEFFNASHDVGGFILESSSEDNLGNVYTATLVNQFYYFTKIDLNYNQYYINTFF